MKTAKVMGPSPSITRQTEHQCENTIPKIPGMTSIITKVICFQYFYLVNLEWQDWRWGHVILIINLIEMLSSVEFTLPTTLGHFRIIFITEESLNIKPMTKSLKLQGKKKAISSAPILCSKISSIHICIITICKYQG